MVSLVIRQKRRLVKFTDHLGGSIDQYYFGV